MMCWLYLSMLVSLLGWVLLTILVLGWDAHVVRTSSQDVRAGDVVVTSPLPNGELRVGEAVTADIAGKIVIGRVDVAAAGPSLVRVRNDQLSVDVARGQVVGAPRLRVPVIALPLVWLDGWHVVTFAGWLAVTAGAVQLVRPRRRPGRQPLQAPGVAAAWSAR